MEVSPTEESHECRYKDINRAYSWQAGGHNAAVLVPQRLAVLPKAQARPQRAARLSALALWGGPLMLLTRDVLSDKDGLVSSAPVTAGSLRWSPEDGVYGEGGPRRLAGWTTRAPLRAGHASGLGQGLWSGGLTHSGAGGRGVPPARAAGCPWRALVDAGAADVGPQRWRWRCWHGARPADESSCSDTVTLTRLCSAPTGRLGAALSPWSACSRPCAALGCGPADLERRWGPCRWPSAGCLGSSHARWTPAAAAPDAPDDCAERVACAVRREHSYILDWMQFSYRHRYRCTLFWLF